MPFYFLLFLCIRNKVVGGIMFSGCPYVRPVLVIAYLKNRLTDS